MKTLIHTATNKYWSQQAYDRWLAGRDPQDMPLHEAWTSDRAAAARIGAKTPQLPEGCELVEHDA